MASKTDNKPAADQKAKRKTAANPAKKRTATEQKGKQLSALKKHLRDAILPGDTPFTNKALSDAAEFVLSAAQMREEGRSSLVLESETGERRFLRIALVNDDMPFLVDSVAATIAAQGLSIDRLVHPVVPVKRAKSGKLSQLGTVKSNGEARESMIYIETPRIDAKQRGELFKKLRVALGDVRAAVCDWPKVQQAMRADIERVEDPEYRSLLDWLNSGMLTQLGHVTRKRDGSQSGLKGICRKSARTLLSDRAFDQAFKWFDQKRLDGRTREVLVIKSNHVSNVHRRVPLDLFIVASRQKGKATSLSVHAGVWTSAALAAPPSDVPHLGETLNALTADLGFDRSGHAGKALQHAFTALPHDLLISFNREDTSRLATTMMSLVDRPRQRLSLVRSQLGRHTFAFVWLPRDLLSTQTRRQIEGLLCDQSGAAVLDWSLEVEGSMLAMLQFVLDTRETKKSLDEAALEQELEDMLRGWAEGIERHLAETQDPARAMAIAGRYAGAFGANYRLRYDTQEAAIDILRLRKLAGRNDKAARDARLYRLDKDGSENLRLKVYQVSGALPLSDAVPALENFGFRVIKEIPNPLNEGALGTIHEFTLALPEGENSAPLFERTETIEQAIAQVLNAAAEDDPFNRLVIGTGLDAGEANWLRAFYRYLRQTGMGFTIYTVVDALNRAAPLTKVMIGQFKALHDPNFSGDRVAAAAAASAAFTKGLARVSAINDDRLLRLYHSVICAILRTNAFAASSAEALAFKFDSVRVPALPKPVPWREIFVYSRRVEGIHLRAGAIARGGLRWSDRRDDFRTEILGLMKAQRVKNAVIVPTGAKGGFYPKQLPSPAKDREAWAAEGQASYELFIRTLLSITDNIVKDKIVHPADVVVHDGEDPYFVVAADKGTASFSDIANSIAETRKFWLDDAFASGGSNGYDHKAMGITARGAWVSVQRHFLEQGIDVQKDSIKAAGCGDMSGDVFGNGMLLSKAVKLVAAFDHRHIFIDPDPEPAASWKERKRLFDLPRSSWEDYNPKLISSGGGVYSRKLKRIKLPKKARDLLGIEAKEIEPDALVKAILMAEIDLLWFGGIGTYIKAEHENNAVVGDPANDALRVNAGEVRCKVIGEGANLGVTQAGRIAFSLKGGRVNTDFIDNSAGVDCSDNEVNIKIALAAAQRSGKLSEKKRIAVLEQMTDEVAAIVLEDNRLQALALSVAESGGAQSTASYTRLIETLEDLGDLDRRTEGLAESEVLIRRAGDGYGMTRPELAVLLSSAKLVLQESIESSALADNPALEPALIAMFPEPMRKKFAAQIIDHRLRRELVATDLANRIVNRLGLLPAFELAEEEGASLAEVANAFVAAEQLFNMPPLWNDIDQAHMGEATRIMLFDRASIALRGQMADLLRAGIGKRDPFTAIEEIRGGFDVLDKATDALLAGESREQADKMHSELVAQGAPEAIAKRVVHLFEMDGATGLAKLAREANVPALPLADAFTGLGIKLGLDWAQSTAALMEPSDVWERLLVVGLARDYQQMRLDFLKRLVRSKAGKANPCNAVDTWAAENAVAVRQFNSMIGRAQAHTPVAPAVLAQIASQARNLLEA
ncbi:MAG: NAD-glutamate dehydrogenase domain-containing protein [Erythrobacter sp.]